MFFNIYVYRIANPYNTKAEIANPSQQALPFSYLRKDISGRTGEKQMKPPAFADFKSIFYINTFEVLQTSITHINNHI